MFKLLIAVFLNCFAVFTIYVIDRHTIAKKLSKESKQILTGFVFGCLSAFFSSFGVELLGTVVNIRDAAPLSAGLIFGAPSGIIAGVMGGAYRWLSVLWGAGEYTRVACSIATILVGFLAAALRKFMFDDKKPTWGYGVCITIVCEVIHMLLIFITNMKDSAYAFEFVKGASVPMIICNSAAVGLSIIIVSLLSHEKITLTKGNKQIAHTFQKWLLACIVIAYFITSGFNFILQNGMVKIETREIFASAINDVKTDVRGKSDEYMLELVNKISKEYQQDKEISLKYLADKYEVIEINIVDKNGLIVNSTDSTLIDSFDMNSTAQSKEFMVLCGKQTSLVQEYRPMGNNGEVMRKYAGVSFDDGGFVQVGYSAEQFHAMLDGFVMDVTQNRHIGTDGFVAVCDENLNIVSNDDWNGEHISAIGIVPDENMKNKTASDELCETTIVNEINNYSEDYIYGYIFVEGYCIVAAMPKSEAMFMRDVSFYTSMFMQVIIFSTLFVFIYILIKKVIINNLKKVNDTLGEITDGNLNVTVDVRSNEEFASLSDDINTTVKTLKRYIDEAAARIDKELEYAKQIQISALPKNFPDVEDYELYAQMIAAKEVGGDFYDFYKLNDKTVAFLVADVSGKGIPAAMFMMTAKTIIKDLAESGMAVNDIFTRANEKLCENNESGMFVTAWMGILNLETGKLQFANAGHNPPLVKRADGEFEFLRSRAGFVLAGMEGIKYRANEIDFGIGDRLFLYTDGVSEATDIGNLLYGEERIIEFLNKNKDLKATELLPALKDNIDLFVGDAPQFDDITMMIFDRRIKEADDKIIQKTFPAKTEALNEFIAFVEETLEGYGCPLKTQMALCVAIEEVFVNVANYAYGEGKGDVEFLISFDEDNREVTFTLKDKGIPFNPLERDDPDVTLSAEQRQIGGLGIFITKKTMDVVSYKYENNENILTMVKKI